MQGKMLDQIIWMLENFEDCAELSDDGAFCTKMAGDSDDCGNCIFDRHTKNERKDLAKSIKLLNLLES